MEPLKKAETKENFESLSIILIDDSSQNFNSQNYGWDFTHVWLNIFRKDGKMRLYIPISVVKQISVEEVS